MYHAATDQLFFEKRGTGVKSLYTGGSLRDSAESESVLPTGTSQG